MAIEIRELIITATIEGEGDKQNQAPAADGAAKDRDRLIQDCVDQVMRILKEEDRR